MKTIGFILAMLTAWLASAALAPAQGSSSCSGMSCLPDGQCCTVSGTWENICPSAPPSAGGSLTSFSGSLWEDDDITSRNDEMGSATVTLTDLGNGCFNATVSADVCNHGGDLSGPNNADQNGSWEGDTIEAFVRLDYKDCVTSRRKVTQNAAFLTSGGAFSGGSTVHEQVTTCKDVCLDSPNTNVTPC